MLQPSKSSRSGACGFTLVELMVVVAIVGILTAVAIPAYNQSIRKSRRTDAKSALLDLAGREERYYNTNGNLYTATAASLGYNSFTPVGSGYYNVTVNVPNPLSAVTTPTYLISAAPATVDQNKDSACLYFAIDNTGKQVAGTSQGTAVTASPCWQ